MLGAYIQEDHNINFDFTRKTESAHAHSNRIHTLSSHPSADTPLSIEERREKEEEKKRERERKREKWMRRREEREKVKVKAKERNAQ